MAKTAAKAATVAFTATAAAGVAGITKITKDAITEFADYEQLTGGVEKLFGDSADIIKNYAQGAYKTAQISANQYMDTVTSFSASLISGLGGDTKAAAEVANQAIIDMADNANTFGTDLQSIQNAYMGFAKGNFSMLDNLKLGYGGTKEEMVRLINDSGILEKQIKKIDEVSFDQMIKAIGQVQKNLKITGTTAKEASTTIAGSMASAQAAWKNLLTGFADENADIEGLVGDLVDTGLTAFNNLMPRIEQTLKGIGTAVKKVAPVIAKEIPKLVATILPDLISATGDLIGGLATSLPDLISTLYDSLSKAVGDLLSDVFGNDTANKVTGFLSTIKSTFTNIISSIDVSAIMEIIGQVIDTAATVGTALAPVLESIANLIGTIFTTVEPLIGPILEFVGTLANFLLPLVAGLLDQISGLITLVFGGDPSNNELSNQLKIINERLATSKSKLDELKTSRDTDILDVQTQYAEYKTLWERLTEITDETGKVKEGYEEEAKALVEKLNPALGTEMEYVDGQITGYKDLADQIDIIIAKKQAEAILEATRDEYIAYLKEQKTLQDNLGAALDVQAEAHANVSEKEALAQQYLALYNDALQNSPELANGYAIALNNANIALGEAKKLEDDATKAVNENAEALAACQLEISNYDSLTSAVASGGLAEINDATIAYTNSMKTATNSTKEDLKQQKEDYDNYYNALVERQKKGDKSITDDMIKRAKDLKDFASKQFAEAEGIGLNITKGLQNGINNGTSSLLATAGSMASSVLTRMKNIMQIKSPSKITEGFGKFLDEGWAIGIDKNAGLATSAAEDLSNSILSAFDVDANFSSDLTDLVAEGTSLDFLSNGELTISSDDVWMDKLLDKLEERGSDNNITLEVDGKTFAQTSISTINTLTRQTGKLGLSII